MMRTSWLISSIALLLFVLTGCKNLAVHAPYFDDSDPTQLRVGNTLYEATFAKANGALLSLIDKQRNVALLQADTPTCLWALAIYDQGGLPLDSCAFDAADTTKHFAYQWDATSHQLHLRYTYSEKEQGENSVPGPLAVEVLVTPSVAAWVDLQLLLQNQSDAVIRRVAIPGALHLDPTAVQGALVPTTPGVLLDSRFFATQPTLDALYPSWQGLFADYVAFQLNSSHLALYAVAPASLPPSARLRLENSAATIRLSHTFDTYLPGPASDDRWRTTTPTEWHSPIMRLHIGRTYETTIASYRHANSLDMFPSLQTKLDARYSTIAQSPLYKIEYDQPTTYWAPLLEQIPSPALLHWVTYWANGVFDEGYPDYLPPRDGATVGETGALATLFAQARERGFLNMPYTNPTWWDDESATLRDLGKMNVAMRNPAGDPRYECVNGLPNSCNPVIAARDSAINQDRKPWKWIHGGYPIAPHSPAAQAQIATGITELTTLLGSDLIFEDQVGVGDVHCMARTGDCRDYSPWVPHPTAFRQGWLDHTARHAASGLMTEVGYDRMAAHELGFHGSLLLFDQRGELDAKWGAGNWQPYPFATMLLRDKVLFYQHNLAPESFTNNLATLRWNLAMGYQLSYGLNVVEGRGGPHSPWLQVVSLVQRTLLAPHVDKRIDGYRPLAHGVTETTYGPVRVIANWQSDAPFAIGDHELAPDGFFFVDHAYGHTAGVFTTYNGHPLPPGDQLILEERTANAVRLYHPLGNAEQIAVQVPTTWPPNQPITITAIGTDGTTLASATAISTGTPTGTPSGIMVTVPYARVINGHAVAFYELSPSQEPANGTIPGQE